MLITYASFGRFTYQNVRVIGCSVNGVYIYIYQSQEQSDAPWVFRAVTNIFVSSFISHVTVCPWNKGFDITPTYDTSTAVLSDKLKYM